MKFDQAALRTAEFIAQGGLKLSPSYSQVKPKSYLPLQHMNELGFLTQDSQDGQDRTERAYVQGWMQEARALNFMEAFNMQTDKVSIRVLPGPKWGGGGIPVTASNGKPATRIQLYVDKPGYMSEKSKLAWTQEQRHAW
jgi:hypothetical protein